VTLTFDLLTLKVVSESFVTWTSDVRQTNIRLPSSLNATPRRAGHNNQLKTDSNAKFCTNVSASNNMTTTTCCCISLHPILVCSFVLFFFQDSRLNGPVVTFLAACNIVIVTAIHQSGTRRWAAHYWLRVSDPTREKLIDNIFKTPYMQ